MTRLRVAVYLLVCGILLSGCPSSYELGFQGPNEIKAYTTQFGDSWDLTVIYPDCEPPPEGFPVVIFSPGFIQPRATYEGFGKQLAQWGYVTILRAYPALGFGGFAWAMIDEHVAQCRQLIDWVTEENLRPESPLYGLVNADKIGVTGHSHGASTSIATTVVDSRVKALVSLDVFYDGADLDIGDGLMDRGAAVMYITADCGGYCSISPLATVPLIDATPAPAVQVTLIGADHMDFLDTAIGFSYGGYLMCPNGPMDNQLARDLAAKYMISWFNVYLYGKEEFADYYNGTKADEDEAAGLVSFTRKFE